MNSTQKLLFDKALQIRDRAYAPYSKFHVGASLITPNGSIYTGCNVENASYSLVTCAETNAISQMVAAGEHRIAELLLICGNNELGKPCGACRQRIREFANDATPVHLCSPEGKIKTVTLGDLLPLSFGPEDLK